MHIVNTKVTIILCGIITQRMNNILPTSFVARLYQCFHRCNKSLNLNRDCEFFFGSSFENPFISYDLCSTRRKIFLNLDQLHSFALIVSKNKSYARKDVKNGVKNYDWTINIFRLVFPQTLVSDLKQHNGQSYRKYLLQLGIKN
jgi:hypothetical protein